MSIELKQITPKNITSFIRGTSKKLLDDLDIVNVPEHEAKQIIIRASTCSDCLENGSCFHCGCTTPDLFYDPKKVDAKKKWGKMMSKEEWEKFEDSIYNYILDAYSSMTSAAYVVTKNSITKDLGNIKHNAPVDIDFSITNNTNDILKIASISHTCGCTSSKYDTSALPGELLNITITYSANQKGSFTKRSEVLFTGDKEPIALIITGTVV